MSSKLFDIPSSLGRARANSFSARFEAAKRKHKKRSRHSMLHCTNLNESHANKIALDQSFANLQRYPLSGRPPLGGLQCDIDDDLGVTLRKARKRIDAIPTREARLTRDRWDQMFASDWLGACHSVAKSVFPAIRIGRRPTRRQVHVRRALGGVSFPRRSYCGVAITQSYPPADEPSGISCAQYPPLNVRRTHKPDFCRTLSSFASPK